MEKNTINNQLDSLCRWEKKLQQRHITRGNQLWKPEKFKSRLLCPCHRHLLVVRGVAPGISTFSDSSVTEYSRPSLLNSSKAQTLQRITNKEQSAQQGDVPLLTVSNVLKQACFRISEPATPTEIAAPRKCLKHGSSAFCFRHFGPPFTQRSRCCPANTYVYSNRAAVSASEKRRGGRRFVNDVPVTRQMTSSSAPRSVSTICQRFRLLLFFSSSYP